MPLDRRTSLASNTSRCCTGAGCPHPQPQHTRAPTHTTPHATPRTATEQLEASAKDAVAEAQRATKERQTELRDEAHRVMRESHEKELAEARRQREALETKVSTLQTSSAKLSAQLDTLKGQLSVEYSEQLRTQEEEHLKAMQVRPSIARGTLSLLPWLCKLRGLCVVLALCGFEGGSPACSRNFSTHG